MKHNSKIILFFLIFCGFLISYSLSINTPVSLDLYNNTEALKSSEDQDDLCWGVNIIDAEKVWGGSNGAVDVLRDGSGDPIYPAGQGVNVLVIDSGIKMNHRELENNYKGGYDSVDADEYPQDYHGHGTQCAGVIAMVDNGFDYLGVAPEVNLYAYRAYDQSVEESGTLGRIRDGIWWAILTHNDDDPTNDIHVISISLGFSFTNFLYSTIEEAVRAGIVVVAATGNANIPLIAAPACHPSVISVGAVMKTSNGVKRWVWTDGTYGSNYGLGLDLVAPGQLIYTTDIGLNDPITTAEGTSMAAPHVAGVCALLISQDLQDGVRDLTVNDIRAILRKTARRDNIENYNLWEYGYGLVNAYGACDLEDPAVNIIFPPSDITITSGTIKCKAIASDNFRVDNVQFKIGTGEWSDADYDVSNDIWTWDWRVRESGRYTISCRAYDARGNYKDTSKSVIVRMGAGCPILSVFDGESYIEEGLLDIHNPDGIDIIYEHTLITQPALTDNRYLLRLTEHPKTISHIDRVELWGELSNGKMVKLQLISAIHDELGQVRHLLWFSDDRKVDELGADYNNGISQSIDLMFVVPRSVTFISFRFIIEGNNPIIK